MPLNFAKLAAPAITLLLLACAVAGQNSGRLSGKVTDADGKGMAGVSVIVTNQTTTSTSTKRTRSDGSYSFSLRGGAYRVSVGPPFEARFDRGKLSDYGIFSN